MAIFYAGIDYPSGIFKGVPPQQTCEYYNFITVHLDQWLRTENLNNLLCFNSEENLIDYINEHGHRTRTMILSFEADFNQFEKREMDRFNFLGQIKLDNVSCLRPMGLKEYKNTIRFADFHHDPYFPEGYLYTPDGMRMSEEYIHLEAAKRTLVYLENKKTSNKFFNLNAQMIESLQEAIGKGFSEEGIKEVLRCPRHLFARDNMVRFYEEKIQEVRDEIEMSDHKYRFATIKNANG